MMTKTLAVFALLVLSFSLGAAAIYEGSLDVSTGDGSIYIGPSGGGGNGCQEAWSCSWSTCVDSSQTYICTDLNSCGTQDLIPAQNGEVQACTVDGGSGGGSSGGGGGGASGDGGNDDMPTDNAGLSGTDSCEEVWLCEKWSNEEGECGVRECLDNNMCGTEELKPFTEKVCENISRASRITGAVTGVTENVFTNPGIYVPMIFIFLVLAGGLALILAKRK